MMPHRVNLPKKLPLIEVSDGVLLPGSTIRIPMTTVKNMNLVRSRLTTGYSLGNSMIGIVTKDSNKDSHLGSLREIGTAGVVIQVTGTNWPRPSYTILVTGLCRFKLLSIIQEHPYPVGAVMQIDYNRSLSSLLSDDEDAQIKALALEFKEAAKMLLDLLGMSIPAVAQMKKLTEQVPTQQLSDKIASYVKATLPEKLQVLNALDLGTRLKITLPLLLRHIQKLKAKKETNDTSDIQEVRVGKMSRGGRNLSLDPESNEEEPNEIAEFETRIKEANLPEHAYKAAMKELSRLKQMPPHMPESSMTRTYLDLLVELPWSVSVKDCCNISKARADLDAEHYGLEKVKRRILEYLAVRQLRGDLKGPILCFVGPPGVGKTSIVRSIANTLGRPYYRMSLGGVSDQHDIRGHRRTYIGSLPGRVLQGLRTVKVNNPVMLLDEIDKLGTGIHGDPAAALLEVLDPEQNTAFTDTYLSLAFDLSQVLFVATANSLSTIPSPLMDRMEIIHVPGYTQEEKVMIGSLHLLPKQLEEHGLTPDILEMSQEMISSIIGEYTREAGVRALERKIGALCRAVAVRVAETTCNDQETKSDSDVIVAEVGDEQVLEAEDRQREEDEEEEEDSIYPVIGSNSQGKEDANHPIMEASVPHQNINLTHLKEQMELPIVVDSRMLHDVLGPPIFQSGLAGRVSVPGVAVGLAWTPVGGEVMVVEATISKGDSNLTLTGQLGPVMQESAKIALSWVRKHAEMLRIEKDFMKDEEIHMHFPAGAISKDGPSAGVTIITVLVSLLTKQCVRSDVAMTGEVTLNGVVLAVGGIKEKILAATRAGLTTVIIPSANKKDLEDIPNSILNDIEVVLVNTVEEVLQAAFDDGFGDMFETDNGDAGKPVVPSSKL